MKKQLLSIMLLGSIVSSYAQEGAREIEEVFVQGKFLNTPYKKVVENVVVISEQEIKNSPAQSIDELLQQVSGLDVRRRGANGVQSDISIRGGSFDQTLILVNGIRMNDSQTGHNSMNIPVSMDNIERIEVIKGPAARRFGNNAYSGVVNIITKAKEGKNAKILAEYGDFNTYVLGASVNLGNEKFAQSLSANTTASDGYRHNTDYKISNVFYQNQLKIKNGSLGVQAGFSEKKFGANGFYANPRATEQYEEVQASIVSMFYQQKLGNLGLKSNVYWRRGQDMYLYIRNRPEVYRNMHLGNNVGGEVNASYESAIGTTGLGVELRKEFLVSSKLGQRDRFLTQVFFEHHFSLFQNKLLITPGISWVNYDKVGNFLYPGVDVGFNFNDQHKVYANVARVNRIPTFTDLYYDSTTELGNPFLKAESAISSEVGYQFRTSQIIAKVSGFMKNSHDAIDWVKSKLEAKWEAKNIGKLDLKGIELEFKHNPVKWLSYSAGYTFIDNKFHVDNNLYSKYALENLKHQFIGKAEFKVGGFSNEVVYRYNQRMDLGDYQLLDNKLTYKRGDYNVYLLITNITNSKYSEMGATVPVPMPGRWFHVGMSYNIGL